MKNKRVSNKKTPEIRIPRRILLTLAAINKITSATNYSAAAAAAAAAFFAALLITGAGICKGAETSVA